MFVKDIYNFLFDADFIVPWTKAADSKAVIPVETCADVEMLHLREKE